MAGNLIGEPFPDWVSGQIKIRQKVHGSTNRTVEEITYLNSRNAWVKLASGVSLTVDKYWELTGEVLGKN